MVLIYRIDNKKEYNELFNYLSKEVAPFSRDEANFCWDYYHKQNMILDMNDQLIQMTGENTQYGTGNLSSPCMIIIDSMNNDKFINFFSKMCDNLNYHIFDFYITPFYKSSRENLNARLLNKEIQILQPKFIITFSQLVQFVRHDKIFYIDLKMFNEMIGLLDKENELNNYEKQHLYDLKTEVWNVLKNINLGYNPITMKL